jgi:hypothetical protein
VQLAEHLGKSISEVMEIPRWELPLWSAFFANRKDNGGGGDYE